MENKTIIVTGASRGLGAAIARLLGKWHTNLVLMARNTQQLQAVARECESAGASAYAVTGDVTRQTDCEAVVQAAVQRFGRVDALVNNSGIIEPIGPIADVSTATWQENWTVNVLGPVMLIQYALPYLREQNGRIINISSGATDSVITGWGAYSSAKIAINKITQLLASEEPAVGVAAVKPGVVDTDMQATIREKGKSRMAEKNYQRLSQMYEQKTINPPEKPGLAIACLALAMPHTWSGEVIQWDEERVQQLVRSLTMDGQ